MKDLKAKIDQPMPMPDSRESLLVSMYKQIGELEEGWPNNGNARKADTHTLCYLKERDDVFGDMKFVIVIGLI